jgi:hypothetical protein
MTDAIDERLRDAVLCHSNLLAQHESARALEYGAKTIDLALNYRELVEVCQELVDSHNLGPRDEARLRDLLPKEKV